MAALIIVLMLIGIVYAVTTYNKTILNQGTVFAIGIEVYWEKTAVNIVTTIDWGQLNPSASKTVTVFIKNIQTQPCILSFVTNNFNPVSTSNYVTLTWNYTVTTIINPNDIIPVNFTNAISANVVGINSYSYHVVITATSL
jgi:hypothetical protein